MSYPKILHASFINAKQSRGTFFLLNLLSCFHNFIMPYIGGFKSIYIGAHLVCRTTTMESPNSHTGTSSHTWKKDPAILSSFFQGCRITAPRMHDIRMCTKKTTWWLQLPMCFFWVTMTWAPCTSKDGWSISPSSMAAKVKALYAVGGFPVQLGIE